MAWNVLLTGAATLLGLAGIGLAAQEPGFDYQVAAPVDTPATATLADYRVAQNQSLNQGGVSARFHDARVVEVLEWLDKQGVNYVIADPSLNDHKITLNIDDQPVGDVADAIASALGGHWEHRGKIRVYKNGPGFGTDFFGGQGMVFPQGGEWNVVPKLPQDKDGQNRIYEFSGPDMKSFTFSSPDLKGLPQDKSLNELFRNDGKSGFGTYTLGNHFDFDKFMKG